MALGKYFISIDSLGIPNPINMSIEPGTVEEVNQSEAGTDLVTVVRTSKPVFNFTWQADSKLLDLLLEFSATRTVTLGHRSQTYDGRFRVTGYELVEGSYRTEGTAGLYTVNATFITI